MERGLELDTGLYEYVVFARGVGSRVQLIRERRREEVAHLSNRIIASKGMRERKPDGQRGCSEKV